MTKHGNAAGKPSRKSLAEDAKISPTTVFDNPNNVVAADGLNKKEKSDILAQWEADAISLQTATDEGMSGGGRPRLDEVKSAQSMLGANKATISAVATSVTCIETFAVQPEKADSLIAELEVLARQAKLQNAGHISTSIHKSDDGGNVVNYSQWTSKTDIEKLFADPRAQALLASIAEIPENSNRVIYDVVFTQ